MRRLALLSVAFALVAVSLYGCDDGTNLTEPNGEQPSPYLKQVGSVVYYPVDLGTLPGDGVQSHARDINNRGQVVGHSQTEGALYPQAFLWEDGEMTDLGTLGGDYGSARAINDRGQVVGASQTESGDTHAFLWEKGEMTDLGTLGADYSYALDINERGQVIGYSSTAQGSETHAFLWEDGNMIDLGPSPGARSWAYGISVNGHVVGESNCQGFLLKNGSMVHLGTLIYECSRAMAVNASDQVVGFNYDEGGELAFAWDDGVMTGLEDLGGGSGWAQDISDSGTIVGYSVTALGHRHAVLWQDGEPIDLGTLGGDLGYAFAINDRGEIVGSSSVGPGVVPMHATLWTTKAE